MPDHARYHPLPGSGEYTCIMLHGCHTRVRMGVVWVHRAVQSVRLLRACATFMTRCPFYYFTSEYFSRSNNIGAGTFENFPTVCMPEALNHTCLWTNTNFSICESFFLEIRIAPLCNNWMIDDFNHGVMNQSVAVFGARCGWKKFSARCAFPMGGLAARKGRKRGVTGRGGVPR